MSFLRSIFYKLKFRPGAFQSGNLTPFKFRFISADPAPYSLTSRVFCFHLFKFLAFFTIFLTSFGVPPSQAAVVTTPITIMLPKLSPACQTAINERVVEFEKKNASLKVDVLFQGSRHSTEFLLKKAESDEKLPDLSVIELAQLSLVREKISLPPLEFKKMQRLVRGMKPFLIHQSRDTAEQFHSLPFLRFAPVLVVNEALLEQSGWKGPLPQRWHRFEQLLKLIHQKTHQPPLAWSLMGPTGFWLIEAWSGSALWNGKGDPHPVTLSRLRQLQDLIYTQKWAHGGLKEEESFDQFQKKKAALWITSSDELAQKASELPFPWQVGLMPTLNSQEPAMNFELQWLIHEPSKEIWQLLQFLYQNNQAQHWIQACGSYPLKKDWKRQDALNESVKKYWHVLKKSGSHKTRPNGSEILAWRKLWIQALEALFEQEDKSADLIETLQLIRQSH